MMMQIWEGLMAAIECMQALYKIDTVSSMFVLFPKAGIIVLKGLYASRNQQRIIVWRRAKASWQPSAACGPFSLIGQRQRHDCLYSEMPFMS